MQVYKFINFNFTGKYNRWDSLPEDVKANYNKDAYEFLTKLAEFIEIQPMDVMEEFFGNLLGKHIVREHRDGRRNPTWFIDQLNQYQPTIVQWLIDLPTEFFIELGHKFQFHQSKITKKMVNLARMAHEMPGKTIIFNADGYSYRVNK